MESLNKVCLIGNVGQDPSIKVFDNGNVCASFSLATSNSWKDKITGEKKTSTDWHRIVCFSSHLCAIIQNYIKKGSKLYIEGSLKNREWEGVDGQKRTITEINLNDFNSKIILLDRKNDNNDDFYLEKEIKTEKKVEYSKFNKEIWALDDEIPF